MNESKSATTLEEDAQYLRLNLDSLSERVSHLPEAAQHDLKSKMDRIDTMVSALERDATEASQTAGASQETARELRAVVETEFARLDQEAETLAIGAPTTVSAALDAILHVVERTEENLKKLTSKIRLPGNS